MPRNLPKHVRSYKVRNERVILVYRRKGMPSRVLPGPLLSHEFNEAYAAMLAAAPSPLGSSRTLAGSMGALIADFLSSTKWTTELAPGTRLTFRPVIERIRNKHGDKPVALLDRAGIIRQLDEKLIPNAAQRDKWLKTMRMLMVHAVANNWCKNDPTIGIKVRLPKSTPHHSWTGEEVAQYRAHWALGTKQRLVLEFALETLSRRMEVARLGPHHVKIVKGQRRIAIERCHGSNDVNIRMSQALQDAVDAMPPPVVNIKSQPGTRTYIATDRGQQYTPDALGHDFAAWAKAAGLPDCCRMHGLKRAAMARLASYDATTKQIMGASGHKTLAMVQLYTEEAERSKLADAAFDKIEAAG
jgi:integrase